MQRRLSASPIDADLLAFTRRLIRLRKAHPALHRRKFFSGRTIRGEDVRDIVWLRFDGAEMSDEDWNNPQTQSLGMFLDGDGLDDVDAEGRPLKDDDLLLLLSSSYIDLPFRLPDLDECETWELLLDTADDGAREWLPAGEETTLKARSVKLYRCKRDCD